MKHWVRPWERSWRPPPVYTWWPHCTQTCQHIWSRWGQGFVLTGFPKPKRLQRATIKKLPWHSAWDLMSKTREHNHFLTLLVSIVIPSGVPCKHMCIQQRLACEMSCKTLSEGWFVGRRPRQVTAADRKHSSYSQGIFFPISVIVYMHLSCTEAGCRNLKLGC